MTRSDRTAITSDVRALQRAARADSLQSSVYLMNASACRSIVRDIRSKASSSSSVRGEQDSGSSFA